MLVKVDESGCIRPPMRLRASSIITLLLNLVCNSRAAVRPAMPPPITMTSVVAMTSSGFIGLAGGVQSSCSQELYTLPNNCSML